MSDIVQKLRDARAKRFRERVPKLKAPSTKGIPRPVYNLLQKQEMLVLHQKDVGYCKIAAKFGCSVETVKVAIFGTRIRDRHVRHMERKCAECGITNDLSVDHEIPLSDGGSNGMSNIRILCMPCNRKNYSNRAVRIGSSFGRGHKRGTL